MLIQSNKEIIKEINNKPFEMRNTKIVSYEDIIECDLSGEATIKTLNGKFNGLIINDYKDKGEIEIMVYDWNKWRVEE